jgi:hypothetical protein
VKLSSLYVVVTTNTVGCPLDSFNGSTPSTEHAISRCRLGEIGGEREYAGTPTPTPSAE